MRWGATLAATAVLALAALSGGCCCGPQVYCGGPGPCTPWGNNGRLASAGCTDGGCCTDAPCVECDAGDCCGAVAACDGCGGCAGYTPFGYLRYMLSCGSGCGGMYWGEWISDPPARCDPCDNHGNWIGPHENCHWSGCGPGGCHTGCATAVDCGCTSQADCGCTSAPDCGCDSRSSAVEHRGETWDRPPIPTPAEPTSHLRKTIKTPSGHMHKATYFQPLRIKGPQT